MEFPQGEGYILDGLSFESLLVLQSSGFNELLNSDQVSNVTVNLWAKFLLRDMLIDDPLSLSVQEEV